MNPMNIKNSWGTYNVFFEGAPIWSYEGTGRIQVKSVQVSINGPTQSQAHILHDVTVYGDVLAKNGNVKAEHRMVLPIEWISATITVPTAEYEKLVGKAIKEAGFEPVGSLEKEIQFHKHALSLRGSDD